MLLIRNGWGLQKVNFSFMMIVWSAVATSVFGVQAMNEPIQFLKISLNAQLNERYFQEMTKLAQLNE